MTEILPWLNLLLVPTVRLLWTISHQLTEVRAVQASHAHRLDNLERKPA